MDHADAVCCPNCGIANDIDWKRCYRCGGDLWVVNSEPLFAEVKRELDRHERLERYCSILATGMAIGLTVGAFAMWGLLAGFSAGLCFVCGVVAQRI